MPAQSDGVAVNTPGDRVWRRATGTAYVESVGGSAERVVVLDLDHLDRAPYVFEASAVHIWDCVDGHRTESEIVAELTEAFGAPHEVVTVDVREFLDRLADLGLLVCDA